MDQKVDKSEKLGHELARVVRQRMKRRDKEVDQAKDELDKLNNPQDSIEAEDDEDLKEDILNSNRSIERLNLGQITDFRATSAIQIHEP